MFFRFNRPPDDLRPNCSELQIFNLLLMRHLLCFDGYIIELIQHGICHIISYDAILSGYQSSAAGRETNGYYI
jgi:hypothetical protein